MTNRIHAETPACSNCFIGFHDVIPWSPDNRCLAIHRAPPDYGAMEDCTNPIEICLWFPETGEIRAVDTTRAWNFQQGARLQWVPGEQTTLAFNTIEDGKTVSIFRNIATGERRVLPAPIYAFSPDGKSSIAPNFTTLAHRWMAYGYMPLREQPPIRDQNEDGIWQLDTTTGEERLFVSTRRATEFEAVAHADPSSHFLCHASFSPDGEKIVFLHRFFSADGGLFTRMIATDREAGDLVLLAQEKVSHFDWLDAETLVVWARFTGGGLAQARSRGLLSSPLVKPLLGVARKLTGRWKKKLLSESYYRIPVRDPKLRTRYGWPSLDADGHPMVARKHGWIVTDFYPDKENRLPTILYHSERRTRVDAHVFLHHPRSADSDVKCDLHPRWDRTERQVAVDTCEAGYRQVRILDVCDVVESQAEHRGDKR
ncbi:MAG TPA: hypothetical protein VND90_11345 [Terracidiphilus sp.]|nr:hypothetical protein [Terracidiphilus sp.]